MNFVRQNFFNRFRVVLVEGERSRQQRCFYCHTLSILSEHRSRHNFTMTLAHYGKARRGTAGSTGKQRRVPDKPSSEDMKDDEDPDETVGGKSDSAPSTPSKSPKKRAQILETKSPSASTLSRRSRRRKRPRSEADEGTESFADCLSTIGDGGINLEISSSPTKSKSPSKKGNAKSLEIPKLNLRRLDSPKAGKKKDSRKEETETEVRDKPPLELEMHNG